MMTETLELQQITDHIVAVTDPVSTSLAGAVALKEFVVVVDATMTPLIARQFRKQVEIHFQLPLKYLLLTHCHGDHVLGLAPFEDLCVVGSTVLRQNMLDRLHTEWSAENFAKWKQEVPADAEWLEQVKIVLPTLNFRNTLEIWNNDKVIEFHHAGGHTSGSSYAYIPKEKVLFAGDLMFAEGFPYAGDATCDPEQWMLVFETLLALDFDTLIPGHGPCVGKDEIKKHLHFFRDLKRATQSAIAVGKPCDAIEVPSGFYEVSEEHQWIKDRTLKHWHQFYR